MSALATRPAAAELVSFSTDQIALMKRTICRAKEREATQDELSLFVGQCKRTGLDPFSKQIYAIFRWDNRLKDEVMSIQTAIDGFRLIAERTGKYLGTVETVWCGADKEWTEVWLEDTHPLAARVTVRKLVAGVTFDSPAVAHWAEYVDSKSPMWKEREAGGMPANQLAKCSEAKALRAAFPNDLSGLYTIDEMAQADAQPATATPVEQLGEGAPEEATVVDPPLSDEAKVDLIAAFKEAGATIDMFLTAVGLDCTDDITERSAVQLTEKLGEHLARQDGGES